MKNAILSNLFLHGDRSFAQNAASAPLPNTESPSNGIISQERSR